MRDINRLFRTGEQLVPAVGYGDAAGLPVETMSAKKIRELYPNGLQALVAPEHNPFYTGNMPAGTTSDDTQLTVAVAEALWRAGGFDIEVMADLHVVAYLATPWVSNEQGELKAAGFGGSTTKSMESLMAGVSPRESGQPDGVGNGIIMKMAPLALWHAARGIDQEQRYAEYDDLTNITHDSDVARACTRLHGEALQWLFENPGGDNADFREFCREVLAQETEADPQGVIDRALSYPAESFNALVARYAEGKGGFKYGFYVPETLAMVYDIFAAAGGDLTTAVWQAANLGGDADSTASIVAAMCTIWSGGEFTQAQDFEAVQHHDRLRVVSTNLAVRALDMY